MKDVMGIIYTGENDARLRELTIIRAIAALPVAGRFRVIDFLVSSMVNGGMKNIGVIMQKNYHSLMDHLGSGKEWDLHGKNNGLHILPPFLTRENVGQDPGVLDALRSNTDYLNNSKQELVVLSNSTIIYNADLREMIAFYESTGADVTLMYTKDPSMKRDEFGTYIAVDESGNVSDIEVELVDKAVAHGLHDLSRDLLLRLVQEKQAKVNAYEYKGVCWNIDSVQSYFKFNMDILKPEIRKRLFVDELPVFTTKIIKTN